MVAADGTYRFARLAAGSYVVALADTEVARAGILLDGRNEVVVDLAAPGWGWEVTEGGPGPGFGIIRCRVKGKPDLPVRLWTVGWAGMTQRTGSKVEFGNDACEFAPLGAGVYTVQPEGIEVKAEARLDGGQALWVTFAETTVQPSRNSVIAGRVTAGAGRPLILSGPDRERAETVGADGAYRFEGLPAGIYRLAVEGTAISQDGIVLDGHNRVTVNLEVPVPVQSIIFGTVRNGAGCRVRLLLPPATGARAETLAAEDGSYKFEKLPPGLYTVAVLEAAPSEDVVAQKTDLNVDGVNLVQADFTLPGVGPAWRWQIEDAERGAGLFDPPVSDRWPGADEDHGASVDAGLERRRAADRQQT